MVEVKTSEGMVARLLMEGILCIVVMLLSKSSGAFLQSRHRARPPSALGHVGLLRRACNRTHAELLGRIDSHRPFSFPKAFSNLVSKVNL